MLLKDAEKGRAERTMPETAMETARTLETFPNPKPERDYLIEHHVNEFTSVCPRTGQPDFATMRIAYVAEATCIELKSLKLYLQSYRDQGIFYEDVTNAILDDLVSCCRPRWMLVESAWTIRGGISTVVTAQHGEPLPAAPAVSD